MLNDRPYLVIPTFIVQPTWGGDYIVRFKKWSSIPELTTLKIGQSYELYSHSRLSLATSTTQPEFKPEIISPKLIYAKSSLQNTFSINELIAESGTACLGESIFKKNNGRLNLLIKFTQALGNSFQLHIKDGEIHPFWKSKPESWYFFEPGVITLGVKESINWQEYQQTVTDFDAHLQRLSREIKHGIKSLVNAQREIFELLTKYNPWRYINLINVPAETLVDLSRCGIHHSWEEDAQLPQGNVVYELQADVSDDHSTIRNFDKGKLTTDGTTRPLQIVDYFKYIDRNQTTNDPKTHITLAKKNNWDAEHQPIPLMETKYYTLEKLLLKKDGSFTQKIDTFRHIFVKDGALAVSAGSVTLSVSKGHSAFIPAAVHSYTIVATEQSTQILISY